MIRKKSININNIFHNFNKDFGDIAVYHAWIII